MVSRVLACFRPQWPSLKTAVTYFGFCFDKGCAPRCPTINSETTPHFPHSNRLMSAVRSYGFIESSLRRPWHSGQMTRLFWLQPACMIITPLFPGMVCPTTFSLITHLGEEGLLFYQGPISKARAHYVANTT